MTPDVILNVLNDCALSPKHIIQNDRSIRLFVIVRLDRTIQFDWLDSPVEPWNDDGDRVMTRCR